MLVNDFGTAFRIMPRTPRQRLHENFNFSGIGYGEQTEAEQPAKSLHSWIGFTATTAQRCADCQPDLIASCRAVDGLQN